MIAWLGFSGAMLEISITQLIRSVSLIGIWPQAFYYAGWALVALVYAIRAFSLACTMISRFGV